MHVSQSRVTNLTTETRTFIGRVRFLSVEDREGSILSLWTSRCH